MGPQTKTVEKRSQATPLAENILSLIQGTLAQQKGAQTVGPMQRTGIGSGPMQQQNSIAQLLGGINTAGILGNESENLIGAVTNKARANRNRSAADLTEGFGVAGNRFSTSRNQGQAMLSAESDMDLNQLISSILVDQVAKQQSAREFDVQANQGAANSIFQLASLGILPEEIIAMPGIGSQILNGLLTGAGAYLAGGGTFGLGKKTPGMTPPVSATDRMGGGIIGEPSVLDPRMFDFSLPPMKKR